MKQFLVNLAIFSFIVLLSIQVFGTQFKAAANKSDYMEAIIDKHQRLASLSGRRMLLVGGSNFAFGVDSKQLEDHFKIPVVNMALHAGLGMEFMLNEAEHVMRRGDLIIVSTEYFMGSKNDDIRIHTAEQFPEAFNYFSFGPLDKLKLYYTKLVAQMSTNARATPGVSILFNIKIEDLPADNPATATKQDDALPVYARRSFNKYGDVIGHLDKPRPAHNFEKDVIPNYYYYEGISQLNEFYNYCKEHGVTVYFMYPTLAESKYQENKASITHTYQDFLGNMKIPALNLPTSLVLPDSLFFDTPYHLTKQGREIRTEKMIKFLVQGGVK